MPAATEYNKLKVYISLCSGLQCETFFASKFTRLPTFEKLF